MNLPMTKQFECGKSHKINLVPITNALPLSDISAAKMDCLEGIGFGDALYNDIIRYSNDSNIQISVHPATCEYYAVYHTAPKEAYVIRIDKVPMNEGDPVETTPNKAAEAQTVSLPDDTIEVLRNSYILGRDQYEADIKKEQGVLAVCHGDPAMEAIARTRLKKAKDNLSRLNGDIDEFEQEHGALC